MKQHSTLNLNIVYSTAEPLKAYILLYSLQQRYFQDLETNFAPTTGLSKACFFFPSALCRSGGGVLTGV